MSTKPNLSSLLGEVFVESNHDSLAVHGPNGVILTIYSKYETFLSSKSELFKSGRLFLSGVSETSSAVTLDFLDGSKVVVDLTEAGFRGPEAMVLAGPSAEFIVWN